MVFRLLWLLTFYLTLFHQSTSHEHHRCFKMKVSLYHFCALYVSSRKTNSHPSYLNTWFLFSPPFVCFNSFITFVNTWQLMEAGDSCDFMPVILDQRLLGTNYGILHDFLQSFLSLKVDLGASPRDVKACRRATVHSRLILLTHTYL